LKVDVLDEIIVDNFAGGGGASTGIELATGRPVTVAVNHDPDAILMHKTNHPYTQHYCESVWDVDPRKVCGDRSVGLAWFSPDCKHFSKAKGGKPVEKNIRGLAWVVLRWAGTVRPRVVVLENVEEFQTWGPVRKGRPVKRKAGQTFHKFINQLRAIGYTVEWNELVAADYGTPTTRKRFFLIARCDGRPVVWPEPTHAPADSPEVLSGQLKPWRAAAEIIDWTLPCPSIFATKEEIKEQYGKAAVRPLAENTMRRAIRGVDKFVLRSARPFILPIGYGERPGQPPRVHDAAKPLPTTVSGGKHYVCTAALTMHNNTNAAGTTASDPANTITTGGHLMEIEAELIAASVMQYHDEKVGEYVRGQELHPPILTTDAANRYSLIGASLVKYYGSDQHGQDINTPAHTATTKDRLGVTAAFFSKYYGGNYKGDGSEAEEPLHTTTAIDHNALACASLIKLKGTNIGSEVDGPAQTVTVGGTHHGIVLTHIVRAEHGISLKYWPQIRDLLNRYCGYTLAEDEVLLLGVGGTWYFISDIGLRMLTPRELYSANGFPLDYVIDIDHEGNPYTKEKQIARCGNAVPPPFATAIVRANLPEWCGTEITTMRQFQETISA
jgi:DNA (cytosine-5)-methyltransferase 1